VATAVAETGNVRMAMGGKLRGSDPNRAVVLDECPKKGFLFVTEL